MRHVLTLLLACLLSAAPAAEWKNELFRVAANVPDSPGWQAIDVPAAPGLTPILAMQHPQKQAVFGITVVHNLPNKNLRDPATVNVLEASLRGFGYQFVGHSMVPVAGREWLQFTVNASNNGKPVSGVVRYTATDEQVFGITLLRGAGQVAAQDLELQTAAASFRVLPPPGIAATPPTATPKAPDTAAPAASPKAVPPAVVADAEPAKPTSVSAEYMRMVALAVGALLAVFIVMKIIGGGSSGGDGEQKPPAPRR